MLTKPCLGLLATVALTANGALAAHHRHAQRHQQEKRNIVYETTTTVTDVTWTTVTVDGDGDVIGAPATPVSSVPSTSSSFVFTSSSSVASSSSSSAVPTTLVTQAAAAPAPAAASTSDVPQAAAIAVAATTTSVVPDIVSAASSVVTSAASVATAASGNKRGAAYNTASLISPLLGDGNQLSWAYNWGSVSDGLSDVDSGIEFVPMLWGDKDDFFADWSANAQAAIDAGAKNLLCFNEPDNPSQANMDAATAATYHQQYMNPFSSKARIGAPAVTNSNVEGESLDWLQSFITACDGNCDFDFCAVHWYNTIDAGAEDLLDFVTKAQSTCGTDKTIWVTEFAPNVGSPSQDQISEFLATVQDAFDNNSTYSFVERYSYFYVSEGLLVSGGAATDSGNAFAYSKYTS